MAALWFLLSLFYLGACLGLAGCGALGIFARASASTSLIACTAALRSALLVAAALVAILYGSLFVLVALSAGWREPLRDGGIVLVACTAVAALLPWTLCLPRLRLRPTALLIVAFGAFYAYGKAFLLVAAGA